MKFNLSILVSFGLILSCAGRPPDEAEFFRAACWDRWIAVEQSDHLVSTGKDGWLFFGPELRHIGLGIFWGPAAAEISRATRPEHADPLPAIVDFRNQLIELGIELLLVPVPPKAMVYPEMISNEVSLTAVESNRLDPYHQAFYDLLRDRGIAVLDLLPSFIEARGDSNGPLYCRTDTHWSSNGCVIAAREIRAELVRRGWLEPSSLSEIVHEWRFMEIGGDLWKALGEQTTKERLRARFVGLASSAGSTPIPPDRSSSVVLLGDSYDLVFHDGDDMHARGAGLPDQLALELGRPMDLVAVRGSGATPARINLMRRARADGAHLAGKKLVIWCFGAREFTESSGWQKVPLL